MQPDADPARRLVYSQDTSPDAISPALGASFKGPAICSSSACVISLQGSGTGGAALTTSVEPVARTAIMAQNTHVNHPGVNEFVVRPLEPVSRCGAIVARNRLRSNFM
jgi:hypothetical protein